MFPLKPAARTWRCLLFLVVAIPLLVFAYQGLPIPLAIPGMPAIVAMILLLATALLLKREGRSMAELGLSWSAGSAGKLVLGFAAGTMLFCLAALLMRTVLPFAWERSQAVFPLAILGMLFFHLASNACEELAFRGYAFDGLIRVMGHWPAQCLIALLSALFHVFCGWSWEVALISTTAGSLLFGLVFVRWRSVPAAIGVHAAWNCSRDLILGVPPTGAALWHPIGMELWNPAQWQVAQMILVGVTLAACAAILVDIRTTVRREHSFVVMK